ncbi:MAG: hypothetical protein ABH873_00810 [Candidatus Firestonebacteria bacterium]
MRKFGVILCGLVFVLCFVSFSSADKVKKVIEVEESNVSYTGMKMAGKLGFGYTNSGTPIGFKYWLGDTTAIDVGFGVATGANIQNFGTNLGFNLVLTSREPILLQFRGSTGFDAGAATNLNWASVLGVEYFVSKNLSLGLGVGVLFYLQVSPASAFSFSHCAGTTGNLGFYYYF